jgi:two-component system, cell cycle sensor histidine kinase and response regulator CckA
MSRVRSSRAVDGGAQHPIAGSRRKAPSVARAARSLAASEAEKTAVLLRVTQRLANVGSMVFSDQGATVEWDEQVVAMFGLEPTASPSTKQFFELVHPEDTDRLRAALEEAFRGKGFAKGSAIIFRVRRPSNGELRHFSLAGEQSPAHESASFIAIVQDVTERVEAEQAMTESEERWRSIATNPYDFVALVDRNGVFRYVNHVAPELTTDQVLGHPLYEFVAPEYHANIDQALAGVFDEGKSAYYESYSPPTGRWFGTVAGPVFRGDQVVLASLQTRDITDARKAAVELSRSARHLKEAQRIAGFGSWVWNTTTDAVEWSEQMFRITGIDPQVSPSRQLWHELVHPEDRAFALAAEQNTLLTGNADQCDYRIVRRSDNEIRRVRTSGEILRNDKGAIVGLLGTTLDVTELRELQEQLLHSQKLEAMGRLAGSVAHDFNNLLVVIGFNTELLLRIGDARTKGYVQEISEATERATSLTRQLLTFARRQVIKPEVLDPDELLFELEPLIERLVGKEVRLVLDLGATEAWIRIDRTQFEQIVLNLTANARDAMPQGGCLTIISSRVSPAASADSWAENRYQLVVEDTGHGMDAQTLKRAFEPFFTTKPPGQGTGLGLATCHAIIKQLAGTIEACSKLGAGTRFSISLPLAERPRGERERISSHLPRGTESVLVIENDSQVRRACLRALRTLGYRALSAGSAEHVVAMLDDPSAAIRLIVSDRVASLEASQQIRERLVQRPELRLLYTSDHPSDSSPIATEAQPALAKPFSLEDLAHAVRGALDGERHAV